MKWYALCAALTVLLSAALADDVVEHRQVASAAVEGPAPGAEGEALVRAARGIENKATCRYTKGPWSECDFKSNSRSRTLTLKKGDAATCEGTKVIQKKCKRGCRYDKASWGPCKENGEMTRTDTLKPNSDPSCEPNRQVTKKCNGNKPAKTNKDKGTKPNKDKGNRRNRQ